MKKITLLFTILTASFGFSQNGGDTCGAAVAVTPGSFTQTEITGTGAELGTGVGSAGLFIHQLKMQVLLFLHVMEDLIHI